MLKSFDVQIGTAATLMSLATAVSIPLYNPARGAWQREMEPTFVLKVDTLGVLCQWRGWQHLPTSAWTSVFWVP
jgi:hypothetical protein